MFIIYKTQLQQMEEAKLAKLSQRTYQIIVEEFPELITTTDVELRNQISAVINQGSKTYRIKSFDLLEDFTIMSFQWPVLKSDPLPADLQRLLTWPNMEEGRKMEELTELLKAKY